jgi:competence protein ComEC
MSATSQTPRRLPGFYRRPCFWGALAAIGGILLACKPAVPPPVWILTFVAGWLLILARRPEPGLLLLVAVGFGLHAGLIVTDPPDSALREGMPVTLRGVVIQRLWASGERVGVVLEAGSRLKPPGWVPEPNRFGLAAPAPLRVGDEIQVNGLLRRPLPATNPGGRSPRLEWLSRGVRYLVAVRPSGVTHVGRRRPKPWEALGRRLREKIVEVNRQTLPPRAALLANSFLIGDEDSPDEPLASEVERVFRDSGMIHLLVVSGTQVSLLLFLFIWVGWRFYSVRCLAWTAGLLALGVYHLVTGGDASVSRAAVMGVVFIAALMLNREPDGENCLGIAALILLLVNPLTVLDVGAQLSFAAVWSIIRLQPPLRRALGPAGLPEGTVPEKQTAACRVHGALAVILAASLAAHLAVAPILALHFQRASWTGILANVVVAVLAAGCLFLVLAHVLLAVMGLPILAPLAAFALEGLHGWAWFFSLPPLGAADVFPTPIWLLPACLALIAVPSLRVGPRIWPLGCALLLATLLFLAERTPAPPPRIPTLRAFDVGQGDAVLLQAPDGANILVDGGPPVLRPGSSPVVRALRALRVGRLDLVVATHPHADHIGGLPEVLQAYPPPRILYNGDPDASKEWAQVLRTAERLRIPLSAPHPGERLPVRGSFLTILGPLDGPREPGSVNLNNRSVVFRWDSAGARFLLTGDVEAEAEQGLLRWGPELRADVLKVAHHGGKRSTGEAWLEQVKPAGAVISCGRDNLFGHPAAGTLRRLGHAGVPVARTDQNGMTTITVRKGQVLVESYVPERAGN